MKNLVVNIGLNVGTTEPVLQLSTTIDILSWAFDFDHKHTRIHDGRWQTEEGVINERVLVAELNVGNMTVNSIGIILEAICEGINQDAIAFRLNGVGHVVYNKNYEGEKFEFNNDYFQTV